MVKLSNFSSNRISYKRKNTSNNIKPLNGNTFVNSNKRNPVNTTYNRKNIIKIKPVHEPGFSTVKVTPYSHDKYSNYFSLFKKLTIDGINIELSVYTVASIYSRYRNDPKGANTDFKSYLRYYVTNTLITDFKIYLKYESNVNYYNLSDSQRQYIFNSIQFLRFLYKKGYVRTYDGFVFKFIRKTAAHYYSRYRTVDINKIRITVSRNEFFKIYRRYQEYMKRNPKSHLSYRLFLREEINNRIFKKAWSSYVRDILKTDPSKLSRSQIANISNSANYRRYVIENFIPKGYEGYIVTKPLYRI